MERWNFVVIGCDCQNHPAVLGKTEKYEHALRLQMSGMNLGWNPIRIFDQQLREIQEGEGLRAQQKLEG